MRLVNTFFHQRWILCAYGNYLYAFFYSWRYKTIKPNNSKDLPINEEINVPEVRVIGPNNEQVGVLKIDDARSYAYNNNVDLVLIVPNATPPVCRAIDYGKFCFERDKREKEAKKKQVIVKVKEIQLSCRIEQHDFDLTVCPKCGSEAIDKLQRITGYLVGTTERWNQAKLAELNDRVVHQ